MMAAVTFGFFSKHKSATRSVATEWLWSWLFLGLLASGNPSRYRYERPSRVVEIKQGRLQGTLVEVPLVSPYSSSAAGNDKNQVGHLMIIVNGNELFYFKAAIVKYRMCDYSKALRCTFFGEIKNSCSSKFVQLLLLKPGLSSH